MSLTFNSLQTLLHSKERFFILMVLIMALLVLGQLYLVVVVAWFVGMFVSRKSSNSNK